MNTPIRYLAIACLALFVALMGNATWVQFVHAGDLNDRNGNRRVIDEEFSRDRGAIIAGGEAIAQSVRSEDTYRYQRTYPKGDLYAPITGYFSYLFGRSAIERNQNSILSGADDRLFVSRVVDLISNKQPQGGSVELTINPLAQSTASAALTEVAGNTRGAVVALDADTGAILAMVSHPSFDPNGLASHDFSAVAQAWKALDADPAKPLINRATQQALPPGSVFKLITASAALENLGLKPEAKVRAGSALAFPGIEYQLKNLGGGNCGGAEITLEEALNVSCNVAFGALAREVGQDKLEAQARKFGYGADLFDELPYNSSRVALEDTRLEAPQLAQSGIGQFNVTATPLQMAIVAAAIANDGRVMKPYLVDTVRAPDLRVLSKHEPDEYGRALSSVNAAAMRQMMQSTVARGTGTSAQIPGVEVGGKTGTAQHDTTAAGERDPENPPYAWFVSYAKANGRTVAVAVVVESSDTLRDEIAGGRLAGPVAKAVIKAALGL